MINIQTTSVRNFFVILIFLVAAFVLFPQHQGDAASTGQTPDFIIKNEADKDVVSRGSTIFYTASIVNRGSVSVKNLVISSILPDAFTFLETGATTFRRIVPILEAGEKWQESFSVLVGADAYEGFYDNTLVARVANYPREFKALHTVTVQGGGLSDAGSVPGLQEIETILRDDRTLPETGIRPIHLVMWFLALGIFAGGIVALRRTLHRQPKVSFVLEKLK